MRAFDMACARPWAITEEWLQTILTVANREGEGAEAVAAKMGRPLDNTHQVTVRDGIATIPIEGPIFRYASLFSAISGATSVEEVATDFRAALDDPGIRGIVLHIDSPGGEVSGINELADMIYAARGQKDIAAYVGNQACSAGYWIASAAPTIVIDPTAALGSIGVVAAVRDPGKQSAREITFVSSQSPNKRPDPTTESGKSQIQQTVDHLADVFVATVARNRGVTPEAVVSDFGAGGVLIGQHAIDAGLADQLGSYEQTLAMLATDPRTAGSMRLAATHNKESLMAGWKDMWKDMFTAMEEHDTEGSTPPQLPIEAKAAERAGPDPEVARLKAELARLTKEQVDQAAAAFGDGEIAANRALPAERATLVAMFTQAAADDAASPTTVTFGTNQQGTRVDALKALSAGRPSHKLTTEQVPTRSMAVLSDDPDEATKLQADVAAFMRQTDLGKAALK